MYERTPRRAEPRASLPPRKIAEYVPRNVSRTGRAAVAEPKSVLATDVVTRTGQRKKEREKGCGQIDRHHRSDFIVFLVKRPWRFGKSDGREAFYARNGCRGGHTRTASGRTSCSPRPVRRRRCHSVSTIAPTPDREALSPRVRGSCRATAGGETNRRDARGVRNESGEKDGDSTQACAVESREAQWKHSLPRSRTPSRWVGEPLANAAARFPQSAVENEQGSRSEPSTIDEGRAEPEGGW